MTDKEYYYNMQNKELIDYVLELVGDDDTICEELHQYESEHEYCRDNCSNLCEECVIRLMKRRIQSNK